MCRGDIAEDKLVEVPPDYETEKEPSGADVDANEPFHSSSKVSYH